HYVMVDEYQDTNRSQYELMRLLTYARKNVCVVGDEDQSIYSWRGADIRNILDFEKDYPNAVTIRLEQNYRSTKTILAAAGAVVAHNEQRKGKVLWSDGEQGSKITLYTAADADQEGLYIAERINRFLNADSTLRVAVLYRTNAQSRLIEEGLRRYGRSYQVVGGTSFYQRAEIKDVLAYLKLSLNHGDSVSLLRIVNTPARGIGKSTVELLEAHAAKQGMPLWDAIGDAIAQNLLAPRAAFPLEAFRSLIEEFAALATEARPGDVLRAIVKETGYATMLEKNTDATAESRLENVQELVNAAVEAGERGETIADFLDHAALVAETDSIDARSQILLMTAHNAKGLEFPVVFLAGMEEGLLPHSRSRDSVDMLEEERRLCYVAMTRAEKHLILSQAQMRRRWGGGSQEDSAPSRFLRELPEELVERKGEMSRSGLRFDDEAEGDVDVDLFVERHEVRRSERKPWTGSSYNSVDNIAGFFRQRGLNPPPPKAHAPPEPARREQQGRKPAGRGIGASVLHPAYGTGKVLRVEGDDEDAKLTVQFPGYGLKKIIRKFAKFTN
ncbi:MAG: ATP-dependent helicase, partial [Bryobacteraceae bacterium]